MADITLTSAVRTNLTTLQSTASLISQTQERLSTGKKVNSALDNPNSFFTASSLNARASDLNNLQDDIGQSVSTLEAADEGIQAIDKLLDAAKGKANQALQTKNAETRAKYAAEFNEIRTQIEDIAKDSGYKGKNLLGGDGNDLLVKFNEDGSSKLNIGAVDYTDLDSDDSAFKLDQIGETIGEVEARDLNKAFTLGEVGSIVAYGSGTQSLAIEDGVGGAAGDTDTVGGTGADGLDGFADGDVIALQDSDGNALKDSTDTEVKLTISSGQKLSDIRANLETALQSAGNASASVTLDAGTLKISGVETSLQLSGPSSNALNGMSIGGTSDPVGDPADVELKTLGAFETDDVISFSYGDGSKQELTIGDSTTLGDLRDAISAVDADVTATIEDGKLKIDVGEQNLVFGFSGKGNGGEFASASKNVVEKDLDAVAGRGWGSDELIEGSLEQVRQAQLDLRAQASTFGTNLSIVTNRQDFTTNLINTLESGAGKLTLADSNLEGANLAALNTQNSIATSTLALAAQASQSVLQLIR